MGPFYYPYDPNYYPYTPSFYPYIPILAIAGLFYGCLISTCLKKRNLRKPLLIILATVGLVISGTYGHLTMLVYANTPYESAVRLPPLGPPGSLRASLGTRLVVPGVSTACVIIIFAAIFLGGAFSGIPFVLVVWFGNAAFWINVWMAWVVFSKVIYDRMFARFVSSPTVEIPKLYLSLRSFVGRHRFSLGLLFSALVFLTTLSLVLSGNSLFFVLIERWAEREILQGFHMEREPASSLICLFVLPLPTIVVVRLLFSVRFRTLGRVLFSFFCLALSVAIYLAAEVPNKRGEDLPTGHMVRLSPDEGFSFTVDRKVQKYLGDLYFWCGDEGCTVNTPNRSALIYDLGAASMTQELDLQLEELKPPLQSVNCYAGHVYVFKQRDGSCIVKLGVDAISEKQLVFRYSYVKYPR